MKIKLKDGKELELTEELIQKVADLIIDSVDLEDSEDLEKPDYPYTAVCEGDCVLFYGNEAGENRTISTDCDGLENDGNWIEERFKPFTGCIHYKNGKPIKTELGGIVE